MRQFYTIFTHYNFPPSLFPEKSDCYVNISLYRIVVSNLHKETKKVFSEVVKDLYNMKSHGRPTPMISEKHYQIIMANADRLNSAIVYDRDFSYQYFGFKTLERSYLLKIDGKVAERPQHMLMRVAVGNGKLLL